MAFLKTENIVKTYASHRALDGISISVDEQHIFGLLGPNGAGKTSLIRIINQITAPDSGEIFINEEKLSPKHIETIGYLPEERGLYKKMKVGEQALYLARLKGMSKIDAKEALKVWFDKFEISEWWDKRIEELSKGMAQKIQFITTVIHRPKLLILDEPFSGFDPINTNLIKEEILKLRDEGATILLSTHNMGSVEEICDDIALINNAKKVLEGNVREIKQKFRTNEYEVEFEGNMIAFTTALWTGFELIGKEQLEKNVFQARIKVLENNSINTLLQQIIPHVQVKGIKEVTPSMNDIFIKAVEAGNEKEISNNG